MSKKAKAFGFIVGWQFVVCALAVAGIFVEIFDLLGIPWNSVGWPNFVGTSVGLLLIELPALIFVGWYVLASAKK